MGQALFPEGHPYHHSIIGSMDDLSAASMTDVQNFFKTYYAPNNAVLVVAGDIDVPAVKQMVRKYFGPIPRGPKVPPLANMQLPAVVGHQQRYVISDALAPAPAVYVGFRVPPATDRRAAAVSLLGDVIGSGRSSRLYDALVRRQRIATNVNAFNFGLSTGADELIFVAVGKPGASADSLEVAMMSELAGASSFTQAELERARAQERFSFVNGLQTTGGFGGRADELAKGWTFFHDPNHINKVLADFDRVSLDDLNALARERLVPANRAVLIYVPAKKTASAETRTP